MTSPYFELLKNIIAFHLKLQPTALHFITFSRGSDTCFIEVYDHLLESLIILSNHFVESEVKFTCGWEFEENHITAIEIAIPKEDWERLETRLSNY